MRPSGSRGAIFSVLRSQASAIARSSKHAIRSQRGRAREMARLLLPPIVVQIASNVGGAEWEYVADHWPKNASRSVGWDDSSVVRVMLDNWEAYKQAIE